jgi:LCP family protein required for cell wall assembly
VLPRNARVAGSYKSRQVGKSDPVRRETFSRRQGPGGITFTPKRARRPSARRQTPGTSKGRPTTSRRAKLLLGVGLVLLALAIVSGVGLWSLTDRYDNSVAKEQLLDPAARRERATVSGPLNYLLVGSDRRASSPTGEERSDTIMVVHIPAGLDRAYLVSVPRDLLVAIPPVPGTGYAGGSDKINAAFQHGGGDQGGTRLLSATLTRLTGLRFDGAALIDFSGFRSVIDLLGGVRMCVDTQVRSIHTNTLFTPGCHQMSGAQALDYARQRYDLPGGDYDRQRHQQQLLRAMADKIASSELAGNPAKLDQVLRGLGSSLTVDTNGLPLEDLVLALRDLRSNTLFGVQVPSYPEIIDETSYVLLDPAASDLFRSLRDDEVDAWARANPRWVNGP